MLTDNDLAPDLSPVMPPAAPAPRQSMRLPEVKTISQARRLAKILLGPLARLWARGPQQFEVGVERGGSRKVFSVEDSPQQALQTAVDHLSEYEASKGHLPKDVIPMFRSSNAAPPLTRRAKALQEYVSAVDFLSPEDRQEIKALINYLPANRVADFQRPISSPDGVRDFIFRLQTAISAG